MTSCQKYIRAYALIVVILIILAIVIGVGGGWAFLLILLSPFMLFPVVLTCEGMTNK